MSYFQARQQGYRALVAVERRRKVIDGIVKGVQDAFWKAAIADRLLPRLDPVDCYYLYNPDNYYRLTP